MSAFEQQQPPEQQDREPQAQHADPNAVAETDAAPTEVQPTQEGETRPTEATEATPEAEVEAEQPDMFDVEVEGWTWQKELPDEAVWVDADEAEMDELERRPKTPQRNYDLRDQHADLTARIAQRRIDVQEATELLASKRSKEAIAADMKVAQDAIAVAEAATAAARQRTATAKEVLAAARAIAARLQRIEQYAQRATKYVDVDITDACNKHRTDTRDRVALEVLEELRGFKHTRDRELSAISALMDEKRENTRILHGSHETIHSPIQKQQALSGSLSQSQTLKSPNAGAGTRASQSPAKSPAKGGEASLSASNERLTSPGKSTSRSAAGATTTRSAAAFSSRHGVVSSPGEVRQGEVAPPAAPPLDVEIAALDLQDYFAMNAEAREQLDALKKQKFQYEQERLALQKKTTISKRRIEAEINELAYQQRHVAHTLAAKRKRVAELEASNSSLMGSLQYTHAALKMTWSPSVRDYFIQAGNNPAPVARRRDTRSASGSPAQSQEEPKKAAAVEESTTPKEHPATPIAPEPEQQEAAQSLEQQPAAVSQQA